MKTIAILFAFLCLSCLSATAQQAGRKSDHSRITVRANIDSASVLMDSELRGFSPCTIETSGQTQVILQLKKEGYVTQQETVAVRPGQDSTLSIHLARLGTFRIASIPAGAIVCIDGELRGNVPLEIPAVPGDTVDITITQQGYQQWSTRAIASEGSSTAVVAQLERGQPSVSVVVDPPEVSVILDGAAISKGSVRDRLTSVGSHQLIVRDDASGRSAEMLTSFLEPRRYFFRGSLGTPQTDRIVGAFLVPGLNQIRDRQYLKGTIMLVGTAALGYLTIRSFQDYGEGLEKYDKAMTLYLGASTDVEATRRHEEVMQRKDDLDKYYARRTVTLSVLAGCYAVSVIDALLNHILGDSLELVPLRHVPGLSFPAAVSGVEMKVKL